MRVTFLIAACVIALAAQCTANTSQHPVKWSQLPDMIGGLDYSSETKVPSIVAADFQCVDGRPICDVHFWGSYWIPGLPTPPDGSPNSDGYPNAVMGGIQQFVIKFWSDVPATGEYFSHPGDLLETVYADVFNEVYYGATQAGKNVYQYNIDLLPNQWFRQVQGNIYWISVEAVLPDANRQWGWHESKDEWNDDATQQFKGSPWYELVNNTYSVDMAFELTTIPEPGSLVALASGLVAAGTLMIRRKRS